VKDEADHGHEQEEGGDSSMAAEQQHQTDYTTAKDHLPALPQSIYTINPPSHSNGQHQHDNGQDGQQQEQQHDQPPLPSLAPPIHNEENSAAAAVEAARRAAEAATAHDGSLIPEGGLIV